MPPVQDARRVIDKTTEYLQVPTVVGFERPFLDFLERDFRALGCEVQRKSKLLAVDGGSRSPRILSAHIDRHGLISTGSEGFQYAAYVAKRLRYAEDAAATRSFLETICDRFINRPVYAYDESSGDILQEGIVRHAHFCDVRENLVFSIDGIETVPINTPISYSRECREDDGYVSGQLDNAISAAVIHTLFEQGFRGRAFFTAEEEIGKSWQHLLAHLRQHDVETREFIVLDTSPFPVPDAADAGLVVLRNKDANGTFNSGLVATLQGICDAEGIPFQMKDEFVDKRNEELVAAEKKPLGLGRTELGRLVQGSNGRWNGATVQLPTFNYHSNDESTTELRRGTNHGARARPPASCR